MSAVQCWYVWTAGLPVAAYNANRYSCKGARQEYAKTYEIDWKLTTVSNYNPLG